MKQVGLFLGGWKGKGKERRREIPRASEIRDGGRKGEDGGGRWALLAGRNSLDLRAQLGAQLGARRRLEVIMPQ